LQITATGLDTTMSDLLKGLEPNFGNVPAIAADLNFVTC
jgi:hypothetical protein